MQWTGVIGSQPLILVTTRAAEFCSSFRFCMLFKGINQGVKNEKKKNKKKKRRIMLQIQRYLLNKCIFKKSKDLKATFTSAASLSFLPRNVSNYLKFTIKNIWQKIRN